MHLRYVQRLLGEIEGILQPSQIVALFLKIRAVGGNLWSRAPQPTAYGYIISVSKTMTVIRRSADWW